LNEAKQKQISDMEAEKAERARQLKEKDN